MPVVFTFRCPHTFGHTVYNLRRLILALSSSQLCLRTKIPLLMTPVHSSTSSPYTHSSCKTNTSICLLLNLLFKRDFPPTLAQGLQEHRWLFPSCCLFLLSLFEASSIPLRAPANANVNINNRPAMVLVRRKALLGVWCILSALSGGGGGRKGFVLILSIGRMGHLAEENSISVGFCGGFYCHMGCNAASDGLYGLPRKISGAGGGGSPAEGEKKRSSGLHKRTSNKLLSVTVLCSRPDLFFHVTLFPLCLL